MSRRESLFTVCYIPIRSVSLSCPVKVGKTFTLPFYLVYYASLFSSLSVSPSVDMCFGTHYFFFLLICLAVFLFLFPHSVCPKVIQSDPLVFRRCEGVVISLHIPVPFIMILNTRRAIRPLPSYRRKCI